MATPRKGRRRHGLVASLGCHALMRAVEGTLVGVAAHGASEVGMFGVAEDEPGVIRGQVQSVGHRDVGGRETVTGALSDQMHYPLSGPS